MRSTYSYVCACPDGSTDTSCSEKPRFDGNSFDVRIESVTFFIFSSRQLHFQLCEINVSLLLIFCSCSEPDAARGLCRRPQQSRDVTLVACVLAVVLVLLLLLAVIVVVLVLKKSDFFSFSYLFSCSQILCYNWVFCSKRKRRSCGETVMYNNPTHPPVTGTCSGGQNEPEVTIYSGNYAPVRRLIHFFKHDVRR